MHIMRGRDVLEYHWIVDMLSLSYRIVIVSWRIVMHTLCERYLRRHSWEFLRSV